MAEVPLKVIAPTQCREARALLGWSRERLAAWAGLNGNTIGRFEDRIGECRPSTIIHIRSALEAAGVTFDAENGEGPSVRLKKDPPGE